MNEYYNMIELSEASIDSVVDTIIERTLQSSDVRSLDFKRIHLINEAKNLVKFLTEKQSTYQKLLNFLSQREELNKKIKSFQNQLEGEKEVSDSERRKVQSAIDNLNISKSEMSRNFYALANENDNAIDIYWRILKFQQLLNDFLGQEQELYYVMSYYGQPLVYKLELNSKESIKHFLTTRYNKDTFTGAFNVSKKQLDAMKYSALEGLEYNTSEELSDTYKEVMSRYKEAKSRSSKNKWIFWKTGQNKPKWDGIKVGQSGDINEAYAIFFFRKKEFLKQTMEKQVAYYALEGIAEVDNISGLLQGDISLAGGRELAIKSSGASMLSFVQVIKIAQEISAEWQTKTVRESVKDLLYKKMKMQGASGDRHKIASALKGEAAKEVQKIYKNHIKSLTN